MNKHARNREKLVDSIETDILSRIEFLERQFYRLAVAHLVEVLDVKDQKIVNKTSNFTVLTSLGKFKEKFRKEHVRPLLFQMAKKFVKIVQANTQYFKSVAGYIPDGQVKKVERNAMAKFGLQMAGSKVKIVPNGFLDSAVTFEDAYTKVREVANTAIAGEVKLIDMKRLVKKSILPDSKHGPIKHRLLTNVNDVYAQFDRMAQKDYAQELGFRAFIYQGGTIKTTRTFCREKNGKVFTIDEAKEWEGQEFDGKNANYNALRDLGGHNCRHFASWISDKQAIRRRPELAQVWGIKSKA